MGQVQGEEDCVYRQQTEAQDFGGRDFADSIGAEGAMGKMEKTTEERVSV